MKVTRGDRHRRPDTRFSQDGRTVFVRLRVDRRYYEFARAWAACHAEADPAGTAELELEGYLNMALLKHMEELDWQAPPHVEALYPRNERVEHPDSDLNDGIPF